VKGNIQQDVENNSKLYTTYRTVICACSALIRVIVSTLHADTLSISKIVPQQEDKCEQPSTEHPP